MHTSVGRKTPKHLPGPCGGRHYSVQICDGEMGKTEYEAERRERKPSGTCTVERGGAGDKTVVRNRQI